MKKIEKNINTTDLSRAFSLLFSYKPLNKDKICKVDDVFVTYCKRNFHSLSPSFFINSSNFIFLICNIFMLININTRISHKKISILMTIHINYNPY